MAVYPDAIVDKFVVDDGHVANPAGSFQVRGVYPSYFVASVCGETTCGDHVAFGVPGTRPITMCAGFKVGDGHYVGGTGVQFGTPKAVFSAVVGGVGSGQLFGTPKFQLRAPPGGVPSAQQFGVPAAKATFVRSVGSVSSAQAFGVPTAVILSFPQTRSVSAVASAQAFGAVTAKATTAKPAGGVPSAQAFGVVTAVALAAPQTKAVSGLGSAQQFGTPTVKATVTRTVGAVGSAQAFGTPTTRLTKQAGGVPSAQQFGVPRTRVTAPIGGVDSAQAFGAIVATTKQRVVVPGVRGSSAYADTIVDQFTVDDGHVVNAESSSSYFGTPWVGHLWLLELDCIDSPAPAICGVLCGVTVCGGESFTELGFCYGDSAIVNTFVCGQMLTGELGASFLDAGFASTIVDQFQVDDGHVVDGQFDNCLDSPLPAICDPGTICGTVVCGGASYIAEIDCVGSLFPTICNEFICGQFPVSGPSLNPPITVTRTIDLVPAGCL